MTESELNKLYKKIFEKLDDIEFDISDAIIPFNEMLTKHRSQDIYSGNEKLPFSERAKEFKLIMKKEFL